MRYAVIYDSPSGNTKRLADEIKEYMDEQNAVRRNVFFSENLSRTTGKRREYQGQKSSLQDFGQIREIALKK